MVDDGEGDENLSVLQKDDAQRAILLEVEHLVLNLKRL